MIDKETKEAIEVEVFARNNKSKKRFKIPKMPDCWFIKEEEKHYFNEEELYATWVHWNIDRQKDSFCEDCIREHYNEMRALGKCNKKYFNRAAKLYEKHVKKEQKKKCLV